MKGEISFWKKGEAEKNITLLGNIQYTPEKTIADSEKITLY